MIASWFSALLRNGESAEFAGPDDEGAVEQSALVEIGEEGSDRLIGLGSEPAVIADEIHVAVPALLILHAAAVDLNEADSSFDHAAGRQALRGKMPAVFFPDAVQLADVFRFRGDREGIGGGRLHAVGEFEAFDAGRQFIFERAGGEGGLIEAGEEVELGALAVRGDGFRPPEVIDGFPLRTQPCALVDTGKETGSPVAGISLGQAAVEGVAHDDERRKAVAFAAEAVGDP